MNNFHDRTEEHYAEKNGVRGSDTTRVVSVTKAAKPVISQQNVGASVNVSISHSNSNATIMYSTGSGYTRYTNRITLTSSKTVQAYAVINGMANGSPISIQDPAIPLPVAAYKWAQPEFPIYIDNLTARCISKGNAAGQYYSASMDLVCNPDEDIIGRVILQVSTAKGTTVIVGTKDVTLKAGQTRHSVSMEIAAAADGSIATAYVVALTGESRTAGALSAEVQADITKEVFYSDWSEWSTSVPNVPEDAIVETKTEYRYNTRSTATSTTSSTMSGYTLYNTTTSTSSYSSWQDISLQAGRKKL